MRLNSGKVDLVLVDEPSSALDPEGELQLFQNLLAARSRKTMIFVTHRFGHLTKFADAIMSELPIYLAAGSVLMRATQLHEGWPSCGAWDAP